MKKTLSTLILDTIIIIISIFLWSMIRYGTLAILDGYRMHLGLLVLIWILTALVFRKYSKLLDLSSIKQVELIVRHSIGVLVTIVILLYFFNIFIPGSFLLALLLIAILLQLIFISVANSLHEISLTQQSEFSSLPTDHVICPSDGEEEDVEIEEDEELELSLYRSLKDVYLRKLPQLLEFINRHIQTRYINTDDSLVLHTRTIFNIEHNPTGKYKVFLNLRQMNDFRNIDTFLKEINSILKPGGYYIGCAQTIEQRCQSIEQRHACLFPNLCCFLDRTINTVFPKIPYLKDIYYYLTDGNNRLISQSEITNNLITNGFQISAIQSFDNKTYFIARKSKAGRYKTVRLREMETERKCEKVRENLREGR